MIPQSSARRFDDALFEEAIVASALRSGRLPESGPTRAVPSLPSLAGSLAPGLATAGHLYQAAHRLAVRDFELNRLFNPAPDETF